MTPFATAIRHSIMTSIRIIMLFAGGAHVPKPFDVRVNRKRVVLDLVTTLCTRKKR